MRLTWLLSLPTILSVVSAMAIQKRDADFLSVRTKMTKDMSGRRGDPKGKYFHESVFHPHYDGRFADKQLGYRERKAALSNLIQTYLATFADIGVETWLMHGTLLGWWWNRKILPWDSDSDVQVTEASMQYLATYYNMSVFHYKTPRIPEGRDYMLEVNPHYVNREQTDKLNVIDARWVDTTSGLFIDITTARYNYTHPAGEGMLSCKDGHEFRDSYIFPLRDTFFEGAPAKIPFAYKEVLEAEYKERALTLQDFEGHHFDENKLEWIPVPRKMEPPKQQAPPPQQPAPQPQKQQAPAEHPKKVEEKKPQPAAQAPASQPPQGQSPPQQHPNDQQKEQKPSSQQAPPQQQPQGQSNSQQSNTQQKPQDQKPSPQQAPQQPKKEENKPQPAAQAPANQQPQSQSPPQQHPNNEQQKEQKPNPEQEPSQQQPSTPQNAPQQQQQQQKPQSAQPQGQTSPPPPITKKSIQAPQVDPKQKAAEDKMRAEAEKRDAALKRQEDRRRASEQQIIEKEGKKKLEHEKALAKEEERKAKNAANEKAAVERAGTQAQSPPVHIVHGQRPVGA